MVLTPPELQLCSGEGFVQKVSGCKHMQEDHLAWREAKERFVIRVHFGNNDFLWDLSWSFPAAAPGDLLHLQ